MRQLLRLLPLIILTNSVTASWQQQFTQGYKSYIAPGFQSSYDYIKSLDPKYILLAGTLTSLATLAYLKYLEKNKYLANRSPEQKIADALEKPDLTYFTPRPADILKAPINTFWGNEILQDIYKNPAKRTQPQLYTYREPDDITIYWPISTSSKLESVTVRYDKAFARYAWDSKEKALAWKISNS